MDLRTGDVFFTRSTSVLGGLIRWGETDRSEARPAWTNHTGVVVEDGNLATAAVVEALWKTRRGPLQLAGGTRVRVYRWKAGLTGIDKFIFVSKASGYVGATYGWWKLAVQLADRAIFGGKKVFSNLMFVDKRPICSYLAAHCFDAINIRFGMDPDAADPDSMMRWCEAHPQTWEFVGEEG
jgi:hypothetical protein